jgi:L-ascorbate metabolism protein UlaG (beta-lactamase superfamily)
MKITWIGHAAVLLQGSKTIIIDPFLTENPSASMKVDDLPHIDVVIATHDHFDHFGDAVAVAKKFSAPLITVFDTTQSPAVVESGIETVGMNIGGTYRGIEGLEISLTPAVHTGNQSGVVVKMNEKTVYHAGDTALFSDMKLIPELFGELDLAMLPIGGHFTMDAKAANRAIEFLRPQAVLPIHYNTWPPIAANPAELHGAEIIAAQPGDSFEL